MVEIIKFPGTGHSENSAEQNPSAETVSFDETLTMAEALTKESGPDAVNAVLKAAAHGKFDPVAESMILAAITRRTKLPKTPLRQQLRLIEQELGLVPNDLALEIARKVRSEHFNGGSHILRCADGSYWVFRGTHWRETTGSQIRKLLLEDANKVFQFYNGSSLSSLVGSSKTCLDDLLGTDEDVLGLTGEPLPVVNCKNGEVWIEADGSASLLPHRPESRLTYCLQIEYDPEAICPKYDKALHEIFGESTEPGEMVRHWHEFVGYAIQPTRDIASFWILIGHGSNAKTVLLKTLQRLVGPEAVLNDQIDSFQRDRFNIAALSGKLLLVDDDLRENVVLDDGLLKKLSEAKAISARHAYGRRKFNYRCLALPVMAGNSYPLTKDVSYGLVRRAQVIPFDRTFAAAEANPRLFPAIWESELPGILNRALEGLTRLRQRTEFKPPDDCVRAVAEFMMHANPLMAFIDEKCAHEPDGRTYLRDFRAAMKAWAIDQGVKRPPTDKTLKRKFEGLGFKVSMVKGYPQIFGLSLKG